MVAKALTIQIVWAVIFAISARALDYDPLSLASFSFLYNGVDSSTKLKEWPREQLNENGKTVVIWRDPHSAFKVTQEVLRFPDFHAVEAVLYFENGGTRDTGVIEEIQPLDLNLLRTSDEPRMPGDPLSRGPFRLHRSLGASATPSDFESSEVLFDKPKKEVLGAGGGRSSNRDFPFFKIEDGSSSYIFAVGWSGQWQATVESTNGSGLRVRIGMENTHFVLRAGERVRSPRILVALHSGDTLEANAQFRQLIYKHYAAKQNQKVPLPTLFCNTCFTRGGGWLNECNAGNQISLIRAYAPFGVEAIITDAGWFEGGWPSGAGNWTPRHDAYPNGMAPVAEAARENGMIYGLWFEPERVVTGTEVQKKFPEAILSNGTPNQQTLLANFGRAEIQDYFFNIVKGFMELPGFRVYRQDFNMDPLSYWQYADAPDRQGITEMKYIEGLYAYWDRIATTWPDSLREECASGGRRIDLETIRHMQMHQKSDYWFDNEVDQASLWSLSQYLPNNVISVPLNRMDDYSFHSAMASSLCLGWIADAPNFDINRARVLLNRYLQVRHLLIGAWYPLLPYSRSPADWMASQYHRPDLGEGMVLVFRHEKSQAAAMDLPLHGLDASATYRVTSDRTGKSEEISGAALMKHFAVNLAEAHSSDLIRYRRAK